MMQAYVSGQAARVVFVEGTDVTYLEAEEPDNIISSSLNEIGHILGGASDVEAIEVGDRRDAFDLLLRKYNLDRGLQLLDIAVSTTDSSEVRLEAAECFVEIIENDEARAAIENYTLSIENQDIVFSNEERLLFSASPVFLTFLKNLSELQIHIINMEEALQRAFSANKIDETSAQEFKSAAIFHGIFSRLVMAQGDGEKVEGVVFDGYLKLAEFPSARQIISDWTRDFLTKVAKKSLRELEKEQAVYDQESFSSREVGEKDIYERIQAVKTQVQTIKDRLSVGDKSTARKFATRLVRFQLQNGGAEYAAKSLSSLAMEARRLGRRSIELEWASQAVELMPNDGVALGVLADTYLNLYRLEEARQAFENCIAAGDSGFGRLGLGRVLRLSGQFEKALETFEGLKNEFGNDHPESVFAWAAYCSTLRDMHRVDDAVLACKRAVDVYPQEVGIRCTYAATLADAGELNDSINEFQYAIDYLNADIGAYCGKASVLRRVGKLNAALQQYEAVVERYPEDPMGFVGRANVMRDLGQFEEALDLYKHAKELFVDDPRVLCGNAETLRDMGRLAESIAQYDSVISDFPLDVIARNGRANALKLNGEFEKALQAYEQNVKDFPYDLYSLDGRADLLKRLGSYRESLVAYDLVIDRQPHYRRAIVSKAAVLVALEKVADAKQILEVNETRTEDDWVALHILGMLALKQNKFDLAEKHFRRGTDETPFFKQRKFFETALAATLIRKSNFKDASMLVAEPTTDVASLILIHSLSELGELPKALLNLEAMNDNLPPHLSELKAELSARYGLSHESPNYDEDWIATREIEVLLQAA